MRWSIMNIICLVIMVNLSQGFYIYITNKTAQCFYNNLFSDEQLLVEVETPIISLAHRVVMRVTANNQTVLTKDIVNVAKITVPRVSVSINDKSPDSQLEYETCFKVEGYEKVDLNANDNIEQVDQASLVIPNGYLMSVKLMSNFSHKLENNKEAIAKTNVNYPEIEKLSERLGTLNSQQVNLHQINEERQKAMHSYLQQTKSKVLIFAILEILMILLFTTMQARLLRGYLNDISII